MNKNIVSTNEEDKPLIFISEEAINLKRDNDNYKKEIERLNNIINKAIAILEKYEVCYRPGELYLKDILLDILKEVDKDGNE